LYQRLKAKGLLVVSGHYFFPGMEEDKWKHKEECIRLTYAQDDSVVAQGIRLIAEEVHKLF
jgi:valine--pyruvate aminotransferase